MAKNNYTEKEESKYQILLNNSPDFVFESRIDNFKFTKVNQRACDFYGYTNEEFLNMSIFDIEVEPLLKEQVRKLYDATPVGEVMEIYGTNKKKDGSKFPVNVRFTKLNNDITLVNVTDITERMKTEVALNESEEQYRLLVEQSTDAIYVIQDEQYVLVNKAWENLFGYSRAEAYSPDFDYWKIIAPQSRPLVKERRISRSMGSLIKPSYEFFGLTQDNRVLHIETTVEDILWKGRLAIQGIYRDITVGKKAEEALRESEERRVQMKLLLKQVRTSIEDFRVYRSTQNIMHRQSNALTDLIESSKVVGTGSRKDHLSSVNAFFSLTIQNIASGLLDLNHLANNLASHDQGSQEVCHLFNCPRHVTLINVLEEAVKVLENTRNSFKSKELGNLRIKLINILDNKGIDAE